MSRNPTLWFRLTLRTMRYLACGSQENSGLIGEITRIKAENNQRKTRETRSENMSDRNGAWCLLSGFGISAADMSEEVHESQNPSTKIFYLHIR
jgi:hypothetical protein